MKLHLLDNSAPISDAGTCGLPFSWEVSRVRRVSIELLQELCDDGAIPPPPEYFRELFMARDKASARKIARSIRISDDDLHSLIEHAPALGLRHYPFFREHTAAPLPNDADWAALKDAGAGASEAARKFTTKIRTAFAQRKSMHAHLFLVGPEWHCFYFTWEDAVAREIGKDRHWKLGDHLHYTSFLFERRSMTEVVKNLHQRHTNVKGEHIPFDVDRTRADERVGASLWSAVPA